MSTPPPLPITDPFNGTMPSVDGKNVTPREHNYDTESLHFEAQIESDLAALDHIPQEQDCVDSAVESLTAKNGNKVQSHHVSCEDLLEFADAKPSSRARGNESDEVRIMSKVLGKDVSDLWENMCYKR